MQHSTPAAPAVRETLERLLASETFSRSERARALLRYLVEQEQAGEAERLKGFSIAVDVFGKDSDFDASSDAVVRVQAGRLRELLTQYFAGEGANEKLRISIPRGSYVPTYQPLKPEENRTVARDASPASENRVPVAADASYADTLPTPPELRTNLPINVHRHVRLFWLGWVAVIAMLSFVVFKLVAPGMQGGELVTVTTPGPDSSPGSEAQQGLPSVAIQADTSNEAVARVVEIFRRALPGFDTVDFIVTDFGAAPQPGKVNFVFNISPGTKPGSATVELQNVESGKILTSRTFATLSSSSQALDDGVAELLSATIPVSGILYAYVEQSGSYGGLAKCLLLNDDYYLDQKSETHEPAYRCFEEMAQNGSKSPLVYSELASLHLEAATDRYKYPPDATEDEALKLAHQGVLMGATSPYAHRSYGFLLSRTGKSQESIRFMRKAYELNTFDLSMAAAYAYALVFAGDYDTAVPIMRRAVEASSAHPSWWDYALFLGLFMLDDMKGAERAAQPLASTKRPHYLGARLIVAANKRDEEQRVALMEQIVKEYPKFAADPRATFVKGKYPDDMTEKLVSALRAAGLIGGS